MNKSDLIDLIAQRLAVPGSEAEKTVNLVLDSIKNAVTEGGSITLTGFGSFDIRSRKPREGRNPHTGETLRIPESRTIGFKPGKSWKESLQ